MTKEKNSPAKIRITKIEELSDAVHPGNIPVGYTQVGNFISFPTVGERFYVGDSFSTSPVQEVLTEGKFKTFNSIYQIDIISEQEKGPEPQLPDLSKVPSNVAYMIGFVGGANYAKEFMEGNLDAGLADAGIESMRAVAANFDKIVSEIKAEIDGKTDQHPDEHSGGESNRLITGGA